MKHILFILVLFIAFGCSTHKKESEVITVSILPQKYFVEQIAGDLFPINVMLPPGASPADYEPTPLQIQEMSNSDFYFYVGHLGFEKSWMKRFRETAENVEYIACSKQIDLLRSDIGHKHDGHDHENGTDPHIWTSPENVKTISRTITTALSKSYPENAEVFNAKLEKFIAKIDSLDYYIRTEFADSTSSTFMIFHPALGYYARDYHLEQLSIEFEGKSPSPAHMKKMVDTANAKNINTVFVQSQFETSKAKAVAKEIGAQVVSIDPLAENWLDEMYALTAKMKKALTTNAEVN
ncbi:MAG: zinc ABC transporter substrate-binding protein [Prolixibacteraceae bacterium]|jgi:zinc transport system substrate-binding protein|nr:zinc ABC transporter substrate-binding protein [Prolixibacteraceae bacterium]